MKPGCKSKTGVNVSHRPRPFLKIPPVMIDQFKLFQIMSLAVATVFIAQFIGRWYQRHLEIERFKWHCDSRFSCSVINNDELPTSLKARLIAAYNESTIPYIKLLFSTKPLHPVNWYNQEQLDAFFD